MKLIDTASKIWNTTKTGTKVHVFIDGTATCRKSIREGAVAGATDKDTARRIVLGTPGLSFCEDCEYRFDFLIREEAYRVERFEAAHAEALEMNAAPAVIDDTKEEEVMTDPRITPEVIAALAVLRNVWHDETVQTAIDTLDNAGIFRDIDEATGYDIDPEPVRVSKCTCPPETFQMDAHIAGCPGDPAEWGDLAYTSKVPGWGAAVEAQRKMNAARRA